MTIIDPAKWRCKHSHLGLEHPKEYLAYTINYKEPKKMKKWVSNYKMKPREFLAGLATGSISPAIKKPFLAKIQKALSGTRPLKIISVDLEAWTGSGDPKFHPDALLLCAGLQTVTITGDSFKVSKVTQYMLNGMTALDIAMKTHEYCKDADAIFGHYSKWDMDIIRNYEPLLAKKFGGFSPMPSATIDIMQPMRNLGLSAGQEHLCSHYDFGVTKAKVNMETWQHAAMGKAWGLTDRQVTKAKNLIRDERNKGCLAANIAQICFISQNIRFMNRFSTKVTYPNLTPIQEMLDQ